MFTADKIIVFFWGGVSKVKQLNGHKRSDSEPILFFQWLYKNGNSDKNDHAGVVYLIVLK